MGTCESLFREDKKKKIIPRENIVNRPKNMGANLFSAPINNSTTNNDINQTTFSQMTMEESHHFQPVKRPPQVYQYINKYKTNGLQRSVAKASLVELGQGNSLMFSGIKSSKANQTNSLYTSGVDDTGYESSYDQCEMIIDGKMDEELVKNTCDQNTIKNYNEFIGRKDSNSLKNNNKIIDYYHKRKDLNTIAEENKEKESDLSMIPSTPHKNSATKNNKKISTGIY